MMMTMMVMVLVDGIVCWLLVLTVVCLFPRFYLAPVSPFPLCPRHNYGKTLTVD